MTIINETHRITPPSLDRIPTDGSIRWELDGKEDDDETQCDACVEACGEDVVISHPPTKVETAHKPLEDESNQKPRRIVKSGSRWHRIGASEEHRDIDISPE